MHEISHVQGVHALARRLEVPYRNFQGVEEFIQIAASRAHRSRKIRALCQGHRNAFDHDIHNADNAKAFLQMPYNFHWVAARTLNAGGDYGPAPVIDNFPQDDKYLTFIVTEPRCIGIDDVIFK